jgi:hypothetical protein
MLPRMSYRQFHDQTNIAVATSVILAEFGLIEMDSSRPRQELTLHGLIQRGLYAEDRGMLFRNALRYLAVAGLNWVLVHDAARTAALENRVRSATPDYMFQFFGDLKSPAEAGFHLESVFSGDARLLLVEARPALRGVSVHVLLVRRDGELCYVMNSHTGQDHAYEIGHVAAHLASPVSMGPVSFAGQQYIYTGIAARVWRQ